MSDRAMVDRNVQLQIIACQPRIDTVYFPIWICRSDIFCSFSFFSSQRSIAKNSRAPFKFQFVFLQTLRFFVCVHLRF